MEKSEGESERERARARGIKSLEMGRELKSRREGRKKACESE